MRLEEIADSIYHLSFPTQKELCSTFLRFQEHYESPYFKGKIFTLEEFAKWYTANSEIGKETGEFTYYEDWAGFNIPSYILEPFYEGKFNPLSEQEESLLSLFGSKRDKKFYIIGTYENGEGATIKHEIAHALFYLNETYRYRALEIVKGLSKKTRKGANRLLKMLGYNKSSWDDEVHAYLITDICLFRGKGINNAEISEASRKLRMLFNEHFKPK